jgi:hypothetical protein
MALFNEDEQHRIRVAIEDAEKHTSGQIRVCIEKTCSEDVLDRAAKYFHKLDMHKTKHRRHCYRPANCRRTPAKIFPAS